MATLAILYLLLIPRNIARYKFVPLEKNFLSFFLETKLVFEIDFQNPNKFYTSVCINIPDNVPISLYTRKFSESTLISSTFSFRSFFQVKIETKTSSRRVNFCPINKFSHIKLSILRHYMCSGS